MYTDSSHLGFKATSESQEHCDGSCLVFSLIRLLENMQEDNKRQGSGPKMQTQAFFSDVHPQAAPSDQLLPEEFAESAKGLAGMDCFELYGGKKKAPALSATAEDAAQKQPEAQATADANAYALASCLNTPYTGEVII